MSDDLLPPKAPDVRALLEPLVRHGVDFVVVGGTAGTVHGSSYPTYDLDIAYDRDDANLTRLTAALAEIGVTPRGAPAELPFQLDVQTLANGANFTFVTSHGDLDILASLGGIKSYEELRSAAEQKQVFGLSVRIASIDHLIAMKRAANRTKDRLMVEEYIVLADERERARRQGQAE